MKTRIFSNTLRSFHLTISNIPTTETIALPIKFCFSLLCFWDIHSNIKTVAVHLEIVMP